MKSKQEIHYAIVALTTMTNKAPEQKDRHLCRKMASLLCWVMDYTNEFNKFITAFKEAEVVTGTDEELDELVESSVKRTMEIIASKESEGGFSA